MQGLESQRGRVCGRIIRPQRSETRAGPLDGRSGIWKVSKPLQEGVVSIPKQLSSRTWLYPASVWALGREDVMKHAETARSRFGVIS
jgi:hypothetical protein